MERVDVLFTDTEACIDESLAMLGVLVSSGRLEPILTQVRGLPSTFQIQLHELNLLRQPLDDPVEVSMLLEVSDNAPLHHFIGFFVQDLPVRLVGMHGSSIPLGHGFKGLVFIVEGRLSVYVHNVRH